MADKYIKCSNCGKKATHETYTSGEYVCEAGNCVLELALDGYVDAPVTDEDHAEFGEEIDEGL
jgi:transcription initiation factor TFIIIB Brf1 subunit/transcription initiation factor TFIIB